MVFIALMSKPWWFAIAIDGRMLYFVKDDTSCNVLRSESATDSNLYLVFYQCETEMLLLYPVFLVVWPLCDGWFNCNSRLESLRFSVAGRRPMLLQFRHNVAYAAMDKLTILFAFNHTFACNMNHSTSTKLSCCYFSLFIIKCTFGYFISSMLFIV